jgi:hypothetical protein
MNTQIDSPLVDRNVLKKQRLQKLPSREDQYHRPQPTIKARIAPPFPMRFIYHVVGKLLVLPWLPISQGIWT